MDLGNSAVISDLLFYDVLRIPGKIFIKSQDGYAVSPLIITSMIKIHTMVVNFKMDTNDWL